jgi:transcriptional regulator of arginine metabolism
MPSATLEQNERRRAIARLIETQSIQRQAELVELLRQEGFPATQSSVSRDLRDLGAAKTKNGYSLPKPSEVNSATSCNACALSTSDGFSLPKPSEVDNAQALQLVAEFVREIRTAGPNLLVIATQVGAAQRVAVTLDHIAWPEIVGTLSGDDTIFVATVGATQQRRLRGRLRQYLKKAAP